uniref:Cilia- and flagella-associated protein 45 n=1 Tax=Nothobranchius kadleci TaxID=1051664 RepID=A0A1A8D1A4_NOTKA
MEGQETIQILSQDLIRILRIPRKDPPKKSTSLLAADFERVTSKPHFLTMEESKALKQACAEEREKQRKAAVERMHEWKEIEASCEKNRAPTDLELEAQEHAQQLVEQARIFKMEQEDEIKQFNQLILNTQCQATRDVQIQEKKQIKAELAEEEKHLEIEMKVQLDKALQRANKIDELRKEQRIRGRQQICKQIQERLENKLIQDHQKEQERLRMEENQKRMEQEDFKAREKERMRQQLLQEEVKRINAEIVQNREKKLEQEKLADMKILEYQRKTQERQAEHEAEQVRIKKEKELEIARLRARQEKAQDYKAQQDELRARRHQESIERQWRMRQKELAAKRVREDAMLREARLDQVRTKELCLAVENNREKAVLEKLLRAEKEAVTKEKEQEERQLQKMLHHSKALRQQMKEQELSAITRRIKDLEEANRRMEQERQRRLRLKEFKEKKLLELKATGIAEKYWRYLEQKAQEELLPLK